MTDDRIVDDIRRRMIALGLRKKGLSREAGLGDTYVRDLLTGRSQNPKTEQFNKLLDALDRLEAKAREAPKRGAK